MAKLTPKQLTELVGKQFDIQNPMLTLYQILADHFYPERADFTHTRNVGAELSDLLVESYPVLCRRDLGNSFSSMLRDGEWFDIAVRRDTAQEEDEWLSFATNRLLGMFNDRSSNFIRSTKIGDHDYATFGQTVLSCELNKQANGLMFRAWHLKDCAWWEDVNGDVEGVLRKWNPTYRQLADYFGKDKLHYSVKEKIQDKPFETLKVTHIVMPSEMYGDPKFKQYPYVSIQHDTENDHIIEEVGKWDKYYVVPRWQKVSGNPYAYSPSTTTALPDARSIQAMKHTMLEAGERYARPPLIGTQKAIRSDVDLSPDGVTWVDDEYDQRTGSALMPLKQDRGGFPIGLEMLMDAKQIINSSFYLNKISLPDTSREMTAYEVAERMKQYRRENLPLFEPLEYEYNGQLCELAFSIALKAGLITPQSEMPETLRGADVDFRFKSPLTATEEEEKTNRFNQVLQMATVTMEIDPEVVDNADLDMAFRDAILGTGAPPAWLKDPDEVVEERATRMQQQMMQAQLEASMRQPQGAPVEQTG